MSWLGIFGIREQLASVAIPSPTSILADLLCLRIAQLGPEAKEHSNDGDYSSITLKLKDDRVIEIYLSIRRFRGPPLRDLNPNLELRVGMPGPPVYRSVDLSVAEAQRVIDAIMALRKRKSDKQRADADALSQHNALDMIERLI